MNAPLNDGLIQRIDHADEREIRQRLREDLPADTFHAQTWRIIWFLPLQLMIWGGISAILLLDWPWYGKLLAGVLVGHSLGAQGLLAHEVMHGALGMSKGWQNFFGWLGFGPMITPPDFWRRWHNVVHHGHTNMGDADPDSFGTLRRYKAHPKLAVFTKLAPGSRTWYSYLFLTYSFVFHAQLVLWMQAKRRPQFKGFNRRKAMLQALVCGMAWAALAVVSGLDALFTVLVPFMVANALVQSYILTNHFLRPQTATNNPLDNSMSLRTWRWLDPLHFRFSHHVEHHLFPKMGSNKAPRVKAWLQQHYADRYVCPSHWMALRLLYQTPRVYQAPDLLVDPTQPERTVAIASLAPMLSR